jgi:hypothetical protein
MGVGARVGFGDREHHLGRTAGQAGQPGLALLLRTELADHLGRDRGGHHQQEQRRPGRGEFLADHDELSQSPAAAAVRLGDVHADEAGFAQGLPELSAGTPFGGPLGVVTRPEIPGYLGHGGPERLVFFGFSKVHAGLRRLLLVVH